MKLITALLALSISAVGCKPQNEVIDNRASDEKLAEAIPGADQESFTSRASAKPGRDKHMGMLYFIWHCAGSKRIIDNTSIFERNNSAGFGQTVNLLNAPANANKFGTPGFFGNRGEWHYWGKPTPHGYYCLSENDDVLRTHANQLKNIGIDYVVVDFTNWPNFTAINAKQDVRDPFLAMLRVWSTVPGAPKIVPWVPFQNYHKDIKPADRSKFALVSFVRDNLAKYPNLQFKPEGKPMIARTKDPGRYTDQVQNDFYTGGFKDQWHIIDMWGGPDYNIKGSNNWSFMSICANHDAFVQSAAHNACHQQSNSQMVPVAVAYQLNFITRGSAARKFWGRTLVQQFAEVYRNTQAKYVLLTGWNEWVAQLQNYAGTEGRYEFVDSYDGERNRDIEPGGRMQDYYYRLTHLLIHRYRVGFNFNVGDYMLTLESLFDEKYYARAYPDVVSAVGTSRAALLDHWMTFGIKEGRRPSHAFDPSEYKNRYKLNSLNNEQLVRHFVVDGFYQGWIGSRDFSAHQYLLRNPDLRARFGPKGGGPEAFGPQGKYEVLRHWITTGQFESAATRKNGRT